MQLPNGSGVNREVPAPFCEKLVGKCHCLTLLSQVIVQETRLKRLEDQMMAHLESATWLKASSRFLPLIIAALVLGHDIH